MLSFDVIRMGGRVERVVWVCSATSRDQAAAIQRDQSIHHDANDIRGTYLVFVGFKAAKDT